MGFPLGSEDRPFSERHLGLGRRLVPSPSGRRGCLLLLYVGFAVIVLAVVFAIIVGTF